MNLYLIGYRCAGKTTVGKALAERLGWPLVDTDRCITDTAGASIAQMVNENGWPYFREQERQALKTVSNADRQVVATGGGIILANRNIETMKNSGALVWLTATEQTIQARLLRDDATTGHRPSLTGQGLIDEIRSVLTERKPLYAKAADITIETDGVPITAICDQIEAILTKQRIR